MKYVDKLGAVIVRLERDNPEVLGNIGSPIKSGNGG